MKISWRLILFLIPGVLIAVPARAQLTKPEAALVEVYGAVSHRAKETINLENRLWTIGERVFFAKQPWKTSALIVDGQCVRLVFIKEAGAWETEELRTLFDRNGGYAAFKEQPTHNIQFRTWKHRDGTEARVRGLELYITHPLYERRVAALTAEAKERAKNPPKP
jgi:hypothetical protein